MKKLSSFAKNMRERIYVNSALIQRLHSSHLQFSTPPPPPTVHLLRRFDALDTINNFKILSIRNFKFLCTVVKWMALSVVAHEPLILLPSKEIKMLMCANNGKRHYWTTGAPVPAPVNPGHFFQPRPGLSNFLNPGPGPCLFVFYYPAPAWQFIPQPQHFLPSRPGWVNKYAKTCSFQLSIVYSEYLKSPIIQHGIENTIMLQSLERYFLLRA